MIGFGARYRDPNDLGKVVNDCSEAARDRRVKAARNTVRTNASRNKEKTASCHSGAYSRVVAAYRTHPS